jgi:hypothetical protein
MPGGICLYQTVYDVVHNRLPFFVNDLGARKLKNIGRVTAYQISPADSGRAHFRLAWYRWRYWLWGAASLLSLALTLFIVFWLGMHREWAASHRGQPGSYTLLPLPPPSPASTPSPGPASAVVTGVTGTQEASESEFRDACFQYMTKYDFDGMEAWMQGHDWPSKKTDTLDQACPKLNHLFTWAHQQMQKYSLAKPLVVLNKERTFYYWPVPFGGVKRKIVLNGAQPAAPGDNEAKIVTMSADQIQPLAMVGIIHTLLKEDKTPLDPLTLQLEQEFHLFIQTYHIVLPNRTAPSPAAPAAPVPNPVVNPAAPNP